MSHEEMHISLPLGKTFIQWDTSHRHPASASSHCDVPIILMIHGGTVPSWQFDAIVPQLLLRSHNGDCDYRILRLDLYGHGRSARPNVRYDLDLFANQVLQALEHCLGDLSCGKRNNNIIGIGHSMGSAILARVAASIVRPHNRFHFHKLVFVAPMLDYKSINCHSKLLSLPIFGEVVMQNVIVPKLKERRRMRYGAIGRPELGERFVEEIETTNLDDGDGGDGDDGDQISFGEMLLRMFRHGAVGDQSNAYKQLAVSRCHLSMNDSLQNGENDHNTSLDSSRSLRIYILWGSHDTVANEKQIMHIIDILGGWMHCNANSNDVENAEELSSMTACQLEQHGITYNKVEGLEHHLLLSHPEVCAGKIMNFLNG